jgi:hypothetical protein
VLPSGVGEALVEGAGVALPAGVDHHLKRFTTLPERSWKMPSASSVPLK